MLCPPPGLVDYGGYVELDKGVVGDFFYCHAGSGGVWLFEFLGVDFVHFAEEVHFRKDDGGFDHVVECGSCVGEDVAHVFNHLLSLCLNALRYVSRFGIHW